MKKMVVNQGNTERMEKGGNFMRSGSSRGVYKDNSNGHRMLPGSKTKPDGKLDVRLMGKRK